MHSLAQSLPVPTHHSAWLLLALALPVLLAGDWLRRRVGVLTRFAIPGPVVGGMVAACLILVLNSVGLGPVKFATSVSSGWWTWLVTPDVEWASRPAKSMNLPLLVGFFTTIGLNATWKVVRAGSWQLPLFWGIASALAVVQNGIGMALSAAVGESPLLGLLCGSVSQTGGHGTALGFAPVFAQAGLAGAGSVAAAAATFGLVAGSLLGGPLASHLIRRRRLVSDAAPGVQRPSGEGEPQGGMDTLGLVRELSRRGGSVLRHALLLAACMKLGAWVSHMFHAAGVVFPPYMGALLLGIMARNVFDAIGWRWISSEIVGLIGGVLLAVFLATAMIGLDLAELRAVAGPMLFILAGQVVVTAAFVGWLTFRLMGADYEAAVMAGGHCGFGLGATPSAIANMDAVTRRYGPAPRAYVVVPPTGAFLIDFSNAVIVTFFLNLVL